MNKTKIKRPRRSTLFLQYFGVTFSIIFVTTLALCFVFVMFMVNYWTSINASTMRRNVDTLSTRAQTFKSASASKASLQSDIHMLSKSTGGDFFLTDKHGNVFICDYGTEGTERTIAQSVLLETLKGNYYKVEKSSIIVGQRVVFGNDVEGCIFGILPMSATIRAYTGDMIKMFIGAAIVSLVFAIVLVYIFSDRMTEPLREMSKITKSYARGNFGERIVLTGDNELTDLADSLNKMAESLAVLDRSRSSFVANVSHELKTPMTSIGGFIDGMLDGTIPESEQKKYLRIVSDEVKRLSTLVQTMLTLSKIEAGEEVLQPAMTDIKNLMFNVLLNFERAIDEAQIEISGFEFMGPVKAVADEKMLYQVIYNLFDNAVKFTNVGGTIYVEAVEEETRVKISISNTGEGIRPDELSFIFDRFYKVDKSRSEHVKGVGLGLNLAKNIVELHGGEIAASSTPGSLTTFSFWIPKK